MPLNLTLNCVKAFSSHFTENATLDTHKSQVSDDRDHAETPFEAYRDLEPFLYRLAAISGKSKATLKV